MEAQIVDEDFVARSDIYIYNLMTGGSGGRIMSASTIEKMSKARKDKTWEEIFGVEEAERHRKIAIETGKKMKGKAKNFSKETRKKLADACRERHTGRKRSKETKKRMSEAQKGKTLSEAHKKRISETTRKAMKTVVTPEYRKKLSIAQKRKWDQLGPKLTKEQVEECLYNTSSIAAALRYAKDVFQVSISRPTFMKYVNVRYQINLDDMTAEEAVNRKYLNEQGAPQ